MTKGMIGGGVNIAHKSKMSNAAKNQMSFPGGMPGPGNYGSVDNNVVGRGMAQYIAGKDVGVKKIGKKAAYKLGDLSVKAGIDNNPEVTRADVIVGAKKKSPKQMGEMEEPPMSEGPAKMSRKERQERRAEKRVNRGEKRTAKLQKKIDEGKDPEGYKASRLKARKKRVDENKKSVGKDFVSDKDKKSNQKVKKAEQDLKKLNFKSTLKKDEGPGKFGKKKAKTKKYIQEKESKIEGKAKRIIGSGSGKVLASRNKKEVGKKYKK